MRRVALAVTLLLVVVGAVAAVTAATTGVHERIATEVLPDVTWDLVEQPEGGGWARRVPLVGSVIDPPRGSWVWHVHTDIGQARGAVAEWLLQQPLPDPTDVPSGVIEVAPTGGIDGRTWSGQVEATGASVLSGDATTVLRAPAVTVTVQPLPIAEGLTQVTVRID